MKRVMFILAVSLMFWQGVLLAQEADKPYSYKFEKGVGECILTGVSLDYVWTTTIKMLMQDKARIASADRQTNIINAEYRPIASWNYDLSLYVEQRGNDVSVTASILPPKHRQGDPFASMGIETASHKEEKKFFDKLGTFLYDKAEKGISDEQ